MIDLVFVRHGLTEWNAAGRIQGRRDIPLAPGVRDSLATRRLPNRFGERCRWVSSPLLRARETAHALGAVDLEIEPRLVEMDWGEWEGRSLPALREELGAEIHEHEARGLDFETPAGDSPRRVRERLRPWLREIAEAGRPVAAVSHKGVGRALLALAVDWDMKKKAPVRLRWDRVHRFEVGANGEARLSAPNIELVRFMPGAPGAGDGAHGPSSVDPPHDEPTRGR